MRKLLWPVRAGFVALALILLPADADDGRLSGSVLCASESGLCFDETASICMEDGEVTLDHAPRGSG
jgi:hypothetical protein